MTIARWPAGVLLVLVTLSGCVSRTGDSVSDDPTPPSEAPPAAADGSDVTACADGNCAVWLEDTMEIPVPGGALPITFTLDGGGSGSTCYVGDDAPELDPAPGELAMLVEGQDTDSPVLRLATG